MKIGALEINPGIMNGACSVAKTIDDVELLAKTSIGAITVGSITLEPRQGNPEPRWFDGKDYALNSFGMPNEGIEFYQENLPKMVELAHNNNKKLSLSVAGFSTAEYVTLTKLADDCQADLLELNLGCPNVSINGEQKPIASFDSATIWEIIGAVGKVTSLPLMLKLSPYSNPAQLKHTAEIIVASQRVNAVVTSNTFPNSLMLRGGQPVLAAGFGGLSGPGFLPVALGQVQQFRQALPRDIAVIGVGGIEKKADVELYKQAGADGVQVATLIVRDGHSAIERLV